MIQVNVKNSNKNCLTDDAEYKIYNQNGNNIELSPCKNVKIDIEYKINNISLLNNRQIDYSKTPVKIMGKLKLHKFANSFNECKKNNNSNNVLCFSTNGKQMLLLEYFLQNNKRNVKTNIYLIGSKKEEMKNLNKVTKSLFPMKRRLFNSKQQNTRYFNNNNNQKNFKNNFNKQKENITIKKN